MGSLTTMVKIAHCTDFSDNARKALEIVLFNFWSFGITIDILHYDDGSGRNPLAQLTIYKNELINNSVNGLTFRTFLFKKSEKPALLKHLNSESYFTNVVGLEGNGKAAGIGSFLNCLYEHYQNNMTMIPFHHEIKIENKGLLAIEYENRDALYNLVKISHFLTFHFAKLIVLIRVEKNLTEEQAEELNNLLKGILPTIKCDLSIVNHQDTESSILEAVNSKQLDYCFIMKGDFFDKLVYKTILSKPSSNTFRESVIRVKSTKEEIRRIKHDVNAVDKITLRPL